MSTRSTGRRLFSIFTIVLFVATGFTAFANVLSDDSEVRARAQKLAAEKAGCKDKCRLVQMNGDRGMLSEDIRYTFDGIGMIQVSCKRPYIAFGDHVCEATKSP